MANYYRCKCSLIQAYGNAQPALCIACAECNTTLEQFPNEHKKPEPHVPVKQVQFGKEVTICKNCLNNMDGVQKLH